MMSERSIPLSAIDLAIPASSSGESSLVKASLNVSDAVAKEVAIAAASTCGKPGNDRLAKDWRFHK